MWESKKKQDAQRSLEENEGGGLHPFLQSLTYYLSGSRLTSDSWTLAFDA